MDKIKIGWHCGEQDWAYKNIAEQLIKALPEYLHVENKDSAVNFLFAVDQLKHVAPDGKTILHLDGNRWYEN